MTSDLSWYALISFALYQGLTRIFVFSDPTIRIPQLVWPTLLWMKPLLFLEIIAKDVLEGR
jgi:hypothetical protein